MRGMVCCVGRVLGQGWTIQPDPVRISDLITIVDEVHRVEGEPPPPPAHNCERKR